MSDETTDEDVEHEAVAPAVNESEQFPSVPVEPDPPSYAPIFTGLGIATFAWGFLTNLIILFTGLAIFIFGISIWIKELTK